MREQAAHHAERRPEQARPGFEQQPQRDQQRQNEWTHRHDGKDPVDQLRRISLRVPQERQKPRRMQLYPIRSLLHLVSNITICLFQVWLDGLVIN